MEKLKNEGNVDNVVLVANDIPVASSLAGMSHTKSSMC